MTILTAKQSIVTRTRTSLTVDRSRGRTESNGSHEALGRNQKMLRIEKGCLFEFVHSGGCTIYPQQMHALQDFISHAESWLGLSIGHIYMRQRPTPNLERSIPI